MTVTAYLPNGFTQFLAEIGIANTELGLMLLDDNAGFDAAHATIDEVSNGTSATVTFSIADPGKVNWTGHGLSDSQIVSFATTGALPGEIDAPSWYYVVNADTNDFEIEETVGGGALEFTGAGTGTHTAFTAGAYEVSGNGWPAGGPSLENVAVSTDDTKDALIDADDVEINASGGTIGTAYAHAIYDKISKRHLKYVDYGEPWKAGDTLPFKVIFPDGVLRLNHPDS